MKRLVLKKILIILIPILCIFSFVKVEASGDSAVSEETAEKTAEKLAPYIDKILGGM